MHIPRPTKRVVAPVCAILGILAAWQGACSAGLVPNFMLPSPVQVVAALVGDLPLLCQHLLWTWRGRPGPCHRRGRGLCLCRPHGPL